jgi:pyruvate/2-oxoglutarate dehydrogenase complex dihydrolipoamide dehydrogenase (E3) component
MLLDYDLVVIGASPAGIYAACMAARRKARVALVTQNHRPQMIPVHYALAQAVQQRPRPWQEGYGWNRTAFNLQWDPQPLTQLGSWCEAVNQELAQWSSLESLAAQGVDVIEGRGEFIRKPRLTLVTTPGTAPGTAPGRAPGPAPGTTPAVGGGKSRSLRSRAYLIAQLDYESLGGDLAAQLQPQLSLSQMLAIPQGQNPTRRLAILGATPKALEMAQGLQRSGWQVTLVPAPEDLQRLDPAVESLVLPQLQLEGVQLLPSAQLLDVERGDGQQVDGQQVDGVPHALGGYRLKLANGDRLEVDQVLLQVGYRAQDTLNLAAAGLSPEQFQDPLVQLAPNFYTCVAPPDSANPQRQFYAARSALKHALRRVPRWLDPFWVSPPLTLDFSGVPQAIYTDPEVAWVGQPAQNPPENSQVLRQLVRSQPLAQFQAQTLGFCQLLVSPQGEILGGQMVGPGAAEAMGIVAWAMQQKLKVQALAAAPFPVLSHSIILARTADQFVPSAKWQWPQWERR